MTNQAERRVFGAAPAGVQCEARRAAYAVIVDSGGKVSVVREKGHWCLPGGGSLGDESPEETVRREVREECGRRARVVGKLGEAVQYFKASGRWYEMSAVFLLVEFEDESTNAAEYEVQWVAPDEARQGFFHACHGWAASRAAESVGGTSAMK